VSLGTYSGDTSCGFVCGGNPAWTNFASRSGTRSEWFRARVFEGSDCSASIEHRIRLISPAGADFDLYVYRPCGTLVGSSTAVAGTEDSYVISRGDSTGSDDSFDYWIEVRYYSGSTCGNWTLYVDGHTC
jgi:hypothetical protein